MAFEYLPLPGTPVEDLDTPALVIDMAVAESNIKKLQSWANKNKMGVRPHAKTHKTPLFAHKQLEAGAIGICCAKVGEAEVMVAGGVKEILIANQVVGKTKIARLMALAGDANIVVAVDDASNVKDLSEAAQATGKRIGVIVEVDTGMHRCGVEPGAPTTKLARLIASSPGLRFDGLMGYEGHVVAKRDFEERKTEATAAAERLLSAAEAVRKAGLPVKMVSAGGTGTYSITGAVAGITDLQCGSYIFMDGDYLEVFKDFRPALSVLATVISRPVKGRAVTDAGIKAISVDRGLPKVVGIEGAKVAGLSEEHGRLEVSGAAEKLKVGDKIRLLPMHGDTTINLYSHYACVRDGKLEAMVEIAGRGRSR
ncbi:MAG: DSD1 family PLP-dependent enzyme [Chloroflexi bacterium]|nr:DSD1 family PLP-dependent enzyme [Chloroflexota bacterium]